MEKPEVALKIPRWVLVVVIVVFGVILALVGMPMMQSDQWSIAEANARLGGAIPSDAFNIQITGSKKTNTGLGVSFDAPPNSATQYAKGLCGGKLFQRYDPFTATDVDMPSRHAYPITLYGKMVYSFSTLATDDDWGNRCEAPDHVGYVQVLNSRSDATLYRVKVALFFSCDVCTAAPG